MDLAQLRSLEAPVLRSLVPAFIAGYIAEPTAAATDRERLTEAIATLRDDEIRGLIDTLIAFGPDARVYPANPHARRISRLWCRDVITERHVEGAERLAEAIDAGPTAIVSNHLSYLDSQATDALIADAGYPGAADRLLFVAGPKVYADLFRLFAAAGLNTLPAPQSAAVSGDAIGPRELARRAIDSMRLGHDAMHAGHVLLVYAEGTRSRTGRLGPFLRAVHRYLDVPAVRVVPLAIVGTERIFPVDNDKLYPGAVSLTFAAPLEVAAEGGAREALEAAHRAIAAMLPANHRPEPQDPRLV